MESLPVQRPRPLVHLLLLLAAEEKRAQPRRLAGGHGEQLAAVVALFYRAVVVGLQVDDTARSLRSLALEVVQERVGHHDAVAALPLPLFVPLLQISAVNALDQSRKSSISPPSPHQIRPFFLRTLQRAKALPAGREWARSGAPCSSP
eukprot:scaffold4274_cov267-Pinguiococcus_pyrenoidosus.AAC.4